MEFNKKYIYYCPAPLSQDSLNDVFHFKIGHLKIHINVTNDEIFIYIIPVFRFISVFVFYISKVM